MVSVVMKRVFKKGHICFELPKDSFLQEALKKTLTACKIRNNDFVLVTIQRPKKPRTTGYKSQNHHLNGHILQICNHTGNDYETVKYAVKMIAVEQFGYPSQMIAGHILPKAERYTDTAECALLIEASHYLAADLGMILTEE